MNPVRFILFYALLSDFKSAVVWPGSIFFCFLFVVTAEIMFDFGSVNVAIFSQTVTVLIKSIILSCVVLCWQSLLFIFSTIINTV